MPKRVRVDLNKDELMRLRDEGKSNKEIAKYFDTTLSIVINNIKRYGLQKGNKKTVDIELLRQYLNEGFPILEVAKKLGVGRDLIVKYMRENNLQRSQEQININRKKTILKMCDGDLDKYYAPIVEKQYKTWQEKTGLENPYQDAEMKEKRKQTCLAKYGCENAMRSTEVQIKARETNFKKYGCAAPFQNKDVQEKARQNYFEKTGYYSPSQNPEVQEKKRINLIEKYGVENPKQIQLNDRARSILLSKKTFEEYLNTCGLETTRDIAIDLGVSDSTIVKAAAKFDLKGYAIVNTSRGEKEVVKFVNSLNVKTIHDRCNILPHLELDIYCPEQKIAIEYNGVYWHSDLVLNSRLYHYNKSKACEERGIRLIHVYEDEWQDPIRREIVKSQIKIALGKVESRIYARECEVREISNKEARPFNNANHIQGHRNAKITYGLFYKDELVQLMSFSWNAHYEAWEIVRGCPGSNNIVVGGVSKLFKHFIREYNPDRIFSYCDYNKFNGVGYEAIGMKYIGETKCNKWYVINGRRYERNPRKYSFYKKNADCVVWGAGSKKYLWEREPDDNNLNQN